MWIVGLAECGPSVLEMEPPTGARGSDSVGGQADFWRRRDELLREALRGRP